MNWSDYPNFSEEEFRCKHTSKSAMHPDFMARLQRLRTAYGKPMKITSGYRDAKHPIESAKAKPGAHASGRACDVAIRGAEAVELLKLALEHGFTGIGVQQKGEGRFIHLDDIEDGSQPRPMIWSY